MNLEQYDKKIPIMKQKRHNMKSTSRLQIINLSAIWYKQKLTKILKKYICHMEIKRFGSNMPLASSDLRIDTHVQNIIPCGWPLVLVAVADVLFSGVITRALHVGHVFCLSNHDLRQCTWKRCPHISFLAAVISSRHIMQVASFLRIKRNLRNSNKRYWQHLEQKVSTGQNLLTHWAHQELRQGNDHSCLKWSFGNAYNQPHGF